MNTAKLLEQRRQMWSELDAMCNRMQANTLRRSTTADEATRFAALYRAACSDLAMAEHWSLPPGTIDYLQRLVARAHGHLYRSSRFPVAHWWNYMTVTAPRAVFTDFCVKAACIIFFGLFSLAALMGWAETPFPRFAERVLGNDQIEMLEQMYAQPLEGNHRQYAAAAAGYIQHNTSIGLQCFALGPLILPSLMKLAYNALSLGASFGYMARADVTSGDAFFEFVTAHGVFELMAIALSAAAGLRLGLGWLITDGMTRRDAFLQSGQRAMPIILVAVVLFVLAAFIEGFISPSELPYALKVAVAIASAGALMFYFCILGYPPEISTKKTTRVKISWSNSSQGAR
jgi:uncharacterized membrane protein SpoIIM required for sporulation